MNEELKAIFDHLQRPLKDRPSVFPTPEDKEKCIVYIPKDKTFKIGVWDSHAGASGGFHGIDNILIGASFVEVIPYNWGGAEMAMSDLSELWNELKLNNDINNTVSKQMSLAVLMKDLPYGQFTVFVMQLLDGMLFDICRDQFYREFGTEYQLIADIDKVVSILYENREIIRFRDAIDFYKQYFMGGWFSIKLEEAKVL